MELLLRMALASGAPFPCGSGFYRCREATMVYIMMDSQKPRIHRVIAL